MPDRRAFILGSAALIAMGRTVASPNRRVIDVHHHYFSPDYLKRASAEVSARSKGYQQVLQWTVDRSLEEMNSSGVSTAVLSMSAPLWFGDAAETRNLTRAANEFARGLVRRHAGRFGYFASLPLPTIDDALAEAAWALDQGGANGVILLTNYDDLYLGDARFVPLLEELHRRQAVVYVHPATASCCTNLTPDIQPAFLELPFDTTRTIGSLLYSGALSRFRGIRFIFAHGGGTVPFLADRLSQWARARPDLAARLPDGPMAELRRLNFDTASVTNTMAMAALGAFIPWSQLLFGTDYPYVHAAPQLAELEASGLPAADLQDICCRNAERLMPGLASAD
jgi:predicted TIM-barrel fold metal-dependent hydrolase